jgi:transposase
MAKPLLPDELWEVIEPLLPKWTPSPKGGQPPATDRAALTGILFVLKTGIRWEDRSAMRAELRLRDDLLAAAAELASRRHLGQDPQGLARQAAGRQQD